MAKKRQIPQVDDPVVQRRAFSLHRAPKGGQSDGDAFGRAAEWIARIMGTPGFLIGMTIFCGVWLGWNTLLPETLQFDPRALNFTLLTLMLSLQASYAAPLLLLAQNRQDDRDRVQAEADRHSAESAHATTDFITREIASLRLAVNDVATRDYVRGELRDLLEELTDAQQGDPRVPAPAAASTHRAPAPVGPDTDAIRRIVREELRSALSDMPRPDAPKEDAPRDR
ncbi:DUF1003 domain-containing protein [Helcobacillus sp. ACRRO]|uniref:DUF1003 domain-containing protein n=1 Tax=Helcobacillus sp. ACRRO TaxID=2918202 RepID=UPI001EF402BE|nr:DUF1003 domain-containing protein [Helcobacillus sp. ACRRO]MCG7427540.1 DUF1003 domain-containing protein [Helcobacillus sp. ACRRO]